MTKILLAVVLLFVAGALATTPRSQALIGSLPGQTFQAQFPQYSGYVTVDEAHGRNLFYWFQTKQGSASPNDPVVLWLNGGPGCSSIGAGAMEENGAYRPILLSTNGTVGVQSEFWAWNKVANIIYLDSPAGVGYSYSDTPSDYNTNDNQTAVDTTTFLEIFFTQVFPDYANRPFWITGESYAGVYIPTLAYNILTNSSNSLLVANLKRGGLMMGNPVTGCDGAAFQGEDNILDLNTQLNMFYWHAMVSPRVYTEWNNAGCNTASPPNVKLCRSLYTTAYRGCGSFDQPLLQLQHEQLVRRDRATDDQTASKKQARLARNGQINPDCLYYSYCVGNATLEFMEDAAYNCISVEDMIATYLNYASVQQALHARPTKWQACGGVHYTRNVGSLIPYLEDLFVLAPSMRILYYSGDIDIATVPFGSTFRCLETMQRPVVDPWRPWGFNQEIAGYVEIYDTYTLATLKGAGHEAPAYQPASAFNMFQAFLFNQPLPKA